MDHRWMGRYRGLVAAFARHVNVISKLREGFRVEISDGVYIDRPAWQIMEYFIEHRGNTCNMNDIAAKLGIPQSSFSKKIKLLQEHGFIDRFYAEGNKKEIIIRPTEKAVQFYMQNSTDNVSKDWQPFFDKLEGFSDEQIAVITEAVETLTDTCESRETKPTKIRYIKL